MGLRVLTQRNPESVWLTENSGLSKVGCCGKWTEGFLEVILKTCRVFFIYSYIEHTTRVTDEAHFSR